MELSTSDYDKEKFKERLAKLSGGVAVLKVSFHFEDMYYIFSFLPSCWPRMIFNVECLASVSLFRFALFWDTAS